MSILPQPITQANIVIGGDTFLCHEIRHPFDSIKSLRWFYGATHKYSNVADYGVSHKAEFDILLNNGEVLKVRPQGTGYIKRQFRNDSFRDTPKAVDELHSLYVTFCKKSESSRLTLFMDMLKEYGFFHYDSKRFDSNAIAINDKHTVDLREAYNRGDLHIHPFQILVILPKSFWQKRLSIAAESIAYSLPKSMRSNNLEHHGDFVISTEWDADIFRIFFEQIWQIPWQPVRWPPSVERDQ